MAAEKNQRGQALIEFIVFLPLIFALYGMISGFANAINGSINQQKITRAYYYFRQQNNSMVPFVSNINDHSWNQFGISMIGWAEEIRSESDEGGQPYAPCYKVSLPMATMTGDSCGTSYQTESTHYIRVGTAYGICGATYGKDPVHKQPIQVPDNPSLDWKESNGVNGCLIQ